GLRPVQSGIWYHGVSGIASDGYDLGLERTGSRVSRQRVHGCDCGAAAADSCQAAAHRTERGSAGSKLTTRLALEVYPALPRSVLCAVERICKMRRRVLTPHPGLATGIGYYLSGMEE